MTNSWFLKSIAEYSWKINIKRGMNFAWVFNLHRIKRCIKKIKVNLLYSNLISSTYFIFSLLSVTQMCFTTLLDQYFFNQLRWNLNTFEVKHKLIFISQNCLTQVQRFFWVFSNRRHILKKPLHCLSLIICLIPTAF